MALAAFKYKNNKNTAVRWSAGVAPEVNLSNPL